MSKRTQPTAQTTQTQATTNTNQTLIQSLTTLMQSLASEKNIADTTRNSLKAFSTLLQNNKITEHNINEQRKILENLQKTCSTIPAIQKALQPYASAFNTFSSTRHLTASNMPHTSANHSDKRDPHTNMSGRQPTHNASQTTRTQSATRGH